MKRIHRPSSTLFVALIIISCTAAFGADLTNVLTSGNKCDPTKQSCAPGGATSTCQGTTCFSSQRAQAQFEKDNNCQFPECSDTITAIPASVLREIFPKKTVTPSRLETIATELTTALNNVAFQGFIDTKRQLAHFLAQVMQEVGAGIQLEESLNYSPQGLKATFSYFRKNPAEADLYGRTTTHPASQEEIANRVYANRLGNGNITSGDGWRYRGRGMIQVTGLSSYKTFTKVHQKIWGTAEVFERSPELLGQDNYAVRSALVFWKEHGLGSIAAKSLTYATSSEVTAVVNLHTNSYQQRFDNLSAIMKLEFFKECIK